MSRYFKHNYLLPNNFGTRDRFFRHRGCKTDEHKHLKNLDNWAAGGFSGQKGLWVLEDDVVNMQGQVTIEDGQTLCIAANVLLQLFPLPPNNLPRIVVNSGGKLSIYGTVKYFDVNASQVFIEIDGDVVVHKVGSLINTTTGGQGYGRICFDSGTFVNSGYIKNKGKLDIAQGLQLENYGTIVNTGAIIGAGSINNRPGSICIGC